MSIVDKTDSEIFEIALPMINDVIQGSNEKNWALFSKYQTAEELNDPDNRKNVEKLWNEHEFFTSLSAEREFLAVIRRDDIAQVIWKQVSTKVVGEYLACYFLKEVDNEVKEVGFRVL
ncbi:hypothetical protein [Marinomonas mediterranea]|jgi:hypothetical protein|uniref:Uncharacterized protein n=1 Tax=Marinomonas mediterranea (strain ATCC 700492 / JCM 21426 / NBRC 103028 / MMB-1) TaxID=717774 RepID=F2JUA5_MARM1|nr:hypothetical protein [Marinomonas mediterranea]ADZ92724.1 hypothetical protein Marme_3509 [Marinomonas mediterranea MMB-1]WCN10655.1 hypothetical protein GV055_17850 [Marinomonas mediterranea]WCN14712.1 hypothetical protein GV054_17725 [Marinomonas mediterranea]WCN18753.1 hypothetical protein GV053_17755 [Marinomonas mediterranea MMB-1]